MHIKQVIISGFRSFKDQREVEAFSPHHNVIVGRNGSGKSNFFNAIQFVLLAPKFATLRQEDRQNLLHEGAGSSVMAAYVEIVFDNADGRFPVDSDEVILRRTVGHKKDEFFLNRKRVDKAEVFSLLESAGFSKSNPYYIVQQGKVAHLCTMKDSDRLNLLKEVAGTTVYEERRQESIKILQDTASKQDRIAEILEFIEQRLQELEGEKDELKQYEELDKRRRALEYNLYDKDLAKATSSLEIMEQDQEEKRNQQHELYAALRKSEEKLQTAEDELASLKDAIEKAAAKRASKGSELADLSSMRSRCEVDLQEAEARLKAQQEELQRLRAERDELIRSIQLSEAELAEAERKVSDQSAELSTLKQSHGTDVARIEALYGKQGRGRQFSSAKERDVFLRNQVALVEGQLTEKNDLMQRLSTEIAADQSFINTESRSIKSAEALGKERQARSEELSRAVDEKLQHRNSAQERRKHLWRELEQIQEEMTETRSEQTKGRQMLSSTLPRAITAGLAAVEKIVDELKIKGYYGPVIDNFSLRNEMFRTCVEVAAGNSLFHVIVDTERTAATLMEELERRRAGRLTFLPLNRLQIDRVQYPNSPDVKPLSEVALAYDAEFEPAMRHVFVRKLLARDLETAARFSKECDLDCVTKDGDVVNRKGGYEGGFHDDRVSRCSAVNKIRVATTKLVQLAERERSVTASAEAIDADINDTLRELKKAEVERDNIRQNYSQSSKELQVRRSELQIAIENLSKRQRNLETLRVEIEALTSQIDLFRKEQGTKLSTQLTASEKAELDELESRERDVALRISAAEDTLLQLNADKERIRAHLKSNLQKRYFEILILIEVASDSRSSAVDVSASTASAVAVVAAAAAAGKRTNKRVTTSAGVPTASSANVVEEFMDASALSAELSRLGSLIVSYETEINVLDENLARMRKEFGSLESLVDKCRTEYRIAEERMAQASKEQDKFLNKRSLVTDLIMEKQRLIRELGSVPRKEVDEFKTLDDTKLLKKLKDVNDKLKKYASVNRKAMDQYVSFNEQRESLIARKDEIEKENDSIQMLIESLDRQKDETILSTFRAVSKHFTEVFDELVPGGHGELVMRTEAEDANGADLSGGETLGDGESDDDQGKAAISKKRNSRGDQKKGKHATKLSVSTFQGVMVRVSFAGSGQQYSMQQLSGGQKALVALSLIFAIQRSDPAPFYLFDEIDQALDASYRTGVARLIQKQVQSVDSPAQFITTTFRPEMVAAADKCYGIALINKVSAIYPLAKADAEKFVTDLLTEEEALTRVAAVPTFSRDSRYSDIVDDNRDVDDRNQSYTSTGNREISNRTRGKVSVVGRSGGNRRDQFVQNALVEDLEGGDYNSEDEL